MKTIVFNRTLDRTLRRLGSRTVQKVYWVTRVCMFVVCLWPAIVFGVTGDEATHEMDHNEDVLELPEVHVHGLSAEQGPATRAGRQIDSLAGIPSSLDGKELDDWMKARMMVSKDAKVTVVVLEPCKHRELTIAGMAALNKWTFEPQMKGDEPIDGELTVRIHFRTR